ncbi:hypothetical protein GE09DRAFT_1048539 [Coniochaeta sp. 2T2.1]|nr:hypothetical protein GE09DRAFT_1048539 [Coniochaeta sp. 2T2.1]
MIAIDRKPNLRVDVRDCSFSSHSHSHNGSVSSFCSTPSMYTPTSGRSSPMYAESGSFDPYFFPQPSPYQYGFTPASSVDSSQYPFSLDLSSQAAMLDSAPCTPSRCNAHRSQNIFGQENPMLQFTPPHTNESISFHDPFMQHHSQFDSPVRSVYGPSESLQNTPMWPMLDSSPLTFSEHRGRPASSLSIMTASSHGRGSPFDTGLISPRQSIDLAQVHQKSAALQRLQRATTRPQPQTTSRAKAPREEQPIEAPRKTTQRVVRKTKHWCTMGCKERGFSRKEHLTRHINDFHLRLVVIECPCCPEENRRVFVGRRDNFMTHLALHITGERRVPYHPKAAEIWEEEKQKSRPRAPSSRNRSRNESASFSEGNDMDDEELPAMQQSIKAERS